MNLESGNILKLIDRLKSQKHWVRLRTVFVLGSLGRKAQPAIPALVDALKDVSVPVRETAAFALGKLGDEAKTAIPALLKALLDEDSGVRQQAATALGKLASDQAISALKQATRDSNDSVRKAANHAIEIYILCQKPPRKARRRNSIGWGRCRIIVQGRTSAGRF